MIRGVSEKMDYRDEAKEIAENFLLGDCNAEERCAAAIMELLDKVRQTQAAECAKHWPIGEAGVSLPDFRCSCGSTLSGSSHGQRIDSWQSHIAALGRK